MFYFFRHSSESSLSYWCRHNIHRQRQCARFSPSAFRLDWEKPRRIRIYVKKTVDIWALERRGEEGGPDDDERRGGTKMCCVISKISDARIWRRLTLHHSVCEPAEFLHSHLSVRISTDRKTLGDRTSCWLLSALIFNSLSLSLYFSLSSWADGLFIETLH